MKPVRRAIFELLVLALAGVVIGFSYNSVRAKGSITAQKNYFAIGVVERPSVATGLTDEDIQPESGHYVAPLNYPGGEPPERSGQLPEHPYHEISFEDVVEVLNDSDTEMGLNVFVDARSAERYSEGHIPGAIRCDPYELKACIYDVLEVAVAAEKIIVYCRGGECTDSIFMCRELVAAGLDFDVIYVFGGGWLEWTENKQPVEKGL